MSNVPVSNNSANAGPHWGTVYGGLVAGAGAGKPPKGGTGAGKPAPAATSSGGLSGAYGGGGGGGGSSTTTTTTISTRQQARAVLHAGLKNILGRRPTRREVDRYLKALNEFERENPQTSTFEGEAGETSGGVSAEMADLFTEDFVRENKKLRREHGAYQAATTYMDVFMKALGPAVNLDG